MSTAVHSKQAFKSIQAALRRGVAEVTFNKIWKSLHNELAIGKVIGNKLHLSSSDRDALRQHIQTSVGLDPLLDEVSGDRLEVAAHISDEKWATQSVFARQVLVKSLCCNISLKTGDAVTPPNSALYVDPELIQLPQKAVITIVENGSAFNQWHEVITDSEWVKSSLVVYRGHGQDAARVSQWFRLLPENIETIAAVDLDPSGLLIAASLGVDAVLLPQAFDLIPLDKRTRKPETFDKQYMPKQRALIPGGWLHIWDWMAKNRVAVTQETMLVNKWSMAPIYSNSGDSIPISNS
jgi:hypothetical protein